MNYHFSIPVILVETTKLKCYLKFFFQIQCLL